MYFAPWDEKRRDFRIKENLPIRYESTPRGKYGNALTEDISEGGVRLTLDEFIPKLSKMLLMINLTPNRLVELNAEVRWAERVSHSYRYEVGLEFQDVNPDTRRSISEYVSSNR